MARLIFQLVALQLVLVATVFGFMAKKKIDHGVKYQLQQKVLTLGTSYSILDDKGHPVYKVNFYFISKRIYTKSF
jgi:hypothetical protein